MISTIHLDLKFQERERLGIPINTPAISLAPVPLRAPSCMNRIFQLINKFHFGK